MKCCRHLWNSQASSPWNDSATSHTTTTAWTSACDRIGHRIDRPPPKKRGQGEKRLKTAGFCVATGSDKKKRCSSNSCIVFAVLFSAMRNMSRISWRGLWLTWMRPYPAEVFLRCTLVLQHSRSRGAGLDLASPDSVEHLHIVGPPEEQKAFGDSGPDKILSACFDIQGQGTLGHELRPHLNFPWLDFDATVFPIFQVAHLITVCINVKVDTQPSSGLWSIDMDCSCLLIYIYSIRSQAHSA